MGIYDRDYYRDSSRGFHPFESRIHACVGLALTYIAFAIIQAGARQAGLFEALVLQADKVLEGEIWRLVTYAFINPFYNPYAIIFNLLFLFWIGHHVEDIYGWKEFLVYYLFAGLLSGVAFVGINVLSGMAKNGPPAPEIFAGPGGSITAVLFLYALHYPSRTFFYYIPVWFVVAFYVIWNTFGAVNGHLSLAQFAAYAAPASFALLYHQYSLRVSNWLPGLPSRGSGQRRSRPKLQIYRDRAAEEGSNPETGSPKHPQPIAVTAPTSSEGADADMNEHLEAKLDQVLEKVKKHGQESLTDEERAVLFRASEIYRKRRKQIGE